MFRTFFSHFRRAAETGDEAIQCLGRHPVNLDTPQLRQFLAGKQVLVSGAGGSIGSEICRQVLRFKPRCLILVEQAENALFQIEQELCGRFSGADIRPYVADICDSQRIASVMSRESPHVVFHCAAHKHVPMMERNVTEAIKNNVLGTKILADASVEAGVEAFVLISSDKAVNPSSVMGASKRCAELYVQSVGRQFAGGGPRPATRGRFLAVRFGNVWGSSGSVVPIFSQQIASGGPVTVTHPDMRRYFMTIPEAAQLVMQAGAIGQDGEVFMLDMGKPTRILDVARAMIRQRGLRPGKDIRIQFTGIRPGEKLYEELSRENEQLAPTTHPGILIWKLPTPDGEQVNAMVRRLTRAATGSDDEARAALREAVPEYHPTYPPPARLGGELAA